MAHRCDSDCAVIQRLYVEERLSLVDVGSRMGLSGGGVRHRLVVHNIPRRKPGVLPGPKWVDEACTMWKSERSLHDIGVVVGVTRERVRQVLRQRGISTARQHRHCCTQACQVVLAVLPPIALPKLSREVGITLGRLRWAAQCHAVTTADRTTMEKLRHVCGPYCKIVPKALAAGLSLRRAWAKVGIRQAGGCTQRYKVYHPDWPWPRPEWWLRPNVYSTNVNKIT